MARSITPRHSTMNEALQKSLTLIFLILLGIFLKAKYKNKDMVGGIKEMVLTVALPSTIFIALMKIPLDSTLAMVPLITVVFNFFLYFLIPPILGFFNIDKNSAKGRTIKMLMPSLAPGLSCFPFVAEFLGEKSLAMAAMADVGNKFFVLIFLYIIALNMFLEINKNQDANAWSKIKSLLLSMVKEPINSIMIVAIVLLVCNVSYKNLPTLITDIFDKTSAMMTPLILLFIGLAVELKQSQKRVIVSLLFFRAGISILFSALLVTLLGISEPSLMLLALVVPLSSASFWPFAHISAFNLKEDKLEISKEKRTFDIEFAVLILAFSLPFSSGLILGILSFGTFFAQESTMIYMGIFMIAISVIPIFINKLSLRFSNTIAKN
jgi:malate permease and related proteins